MVRCSGHPTTQGAGCRHHNRVQDNNALGAKP